MTRARIRPSLVWLLAVALLLILAPPRVAGAEEAATRPSEERVQEEVDTELEERRKALLEEAHAALDETRAALRALDDGKPKEALAALARATGTLELLVAREPELALAPVDAAIVTYDVYATPAAIEKALGEVERHLESGKVQEARALLSGLGSEIVVRVTNLPLATYPDAIKEVSPLIDAGRTEEAKAALQAALDTMVVTDRVLPLPILRARHLLDEAEALLEGEKPAEGEEAAEAEEAAEEGREKVDALVRDAREQLEIARLLGYGDEDDHESLRREIAELETRIGGGEETEGLFARLRSSLERIQRGVAD